MGIWSNVLRALTATSVTTLSPSLCVFLSTCAARMLPHMLLEVFCAIPTFLSTAFAHASGCNFYVFRVLQVVHNVRRIGSGHGQRTSDRTSLAREKE